VLQVTTVGSKLLLKIQLISFYQWRRKRYGGHHTNLKFGMAAPYQSA